MRELISIISSTTQAYPFQKKHFRKVAKLEVLFLITGVVANSECLQLCLIAKYQQKQSALRVYS